MASRFRRSKRAVNAAVDAETKLLDGGVLRIYGGTQPEHADLPVGNLPLSRPLLAEIVLNNPAFMPADNGVATARQTLKDENAKGGGTATWFRATGADGTAVWDGSVGTADSDLVLPVLLIQAGTVVDVVRLSYGTR